MMSSLYSFISLCVLALFVSSCGSDTASSNALTEPTGEVFLAWSAGAAAGLEPCGCSAGMHGGLLRRATVLRADAATENYVVVEGGGWLGGQADYELERTAFFIRGLYDLECNALMLGKAEHKAGADIISQVQKTMRAGNKEIPIVAANVQMDAVDIQKFVRVRRAGTDFILTAVLDEKNTSVDGVQVSAIDEALLNVLRNEKDAWIIVFIDGDEKAAARIAGNVPGLFAVVATDVGNHSGAPERLGACTLLAAGNHGKVLARWQMTGVRDTATAYRIELLGDEVDDDQDMRDLVELYQERLGTLRLSIDSAGSGGGLTALDGAREHHYVGSQACASCHPQAAQIHAKSVHAHALQTLRKKSYHMDPSCLRCHVTGLAQSDGYQRLGKKDVLGLGQVSCESCHGAGSQHVAERLAGKTASGSLRPVTAASCIVCHDKENSPNFNYVHYWEKIRHDRR